MKSKILGTVMVFLAALLWSLVGLFLKSVNASIAWLMFIRCLVAGLVLAPFIFKMPIKPFTSVLMAGVLFFCLAFTFAITTRLGSPIMAVSMQYAAPVYLIGYTTIRYRLYSPDKLFILLLLAVGMACNIVGAIQTAPLIAVGSSIAIGISFLLYTHTTRSITSGSSLGVIAVVNLVSCVCALIVLPFDSTPAPTSLDSLLWIIASGVIISAGSYVLYQIGIVRIALESAILITLSEPILNPLWVFLFIGELPETINVIGLLFIVSGSLLDTVINARKSGVQKKQGLQREN